MWLCRSRRRLVTQPVAAPACAFDRHQFAELLEGWVVPAEPDMIAGVNTETRDVLLKVAQFDSWFAELVESLQVSVVSF